jgi:hypothetical protein
MASPSRYGPLAKPEESIHVEVKENPVRAVLSAYRAWRGMFTPFIIRPFHTYSPAAAEQRYQAAVTLLQPHAREAGTATPAELTVLANAIRDPDAGLFLSALLNETSIPSLEGVFAYHILGYRLAPGKKIAAHKGSRITCLGRHARGDITNHGYAKDMAYLAAGGIHSNHSETVELGRDASAGLFINHGRIGSYLGRSASRGTFVNYASKRNAGSAAWYASGGVFLNYGTLESFATGASDGVSANFGTASSLAMDSRGGVQANLGTLTDDMAWGSYRQGVQLGVGSPHWPPQARNHPPLKRRLATLERLIRRAEHFGQCKDKPDEAIAALQAFDWKDYESGILALGKDIVELRDRCDY